MYRPIKFLAFLAPLVAISLMAAPPLGADWKILYYDRDGRVVGVDGGGEYDSSRGGDRGGNPSGASRGGDSGAGGPGPGASAPMIADLAALPPDQRFKPGEIIVSNPPEGFESRVGRLGFSVVDKVSLRTLAVEVFRLRVPSGESVPAAVTRLRRQFPGVIVDANHLFDPSAAGRTPNLFARSVMGWGKASMLCGRGVRLGAIDGAIDVDHPALAGRNLDYRSFHARDRRPGAIEHGTAIAAMLIGQPTWGGLLPAAELKHANIFEVDERGGVSANVLGLLKGIDWIASQKVHVINLSVAGSNNQVLDQALVKAYRMGFVLVAAAGNGGPEASPAYPAAYDYVIAVTAVDLNQRLYRHANRGGYIEFAAPGVEIWTAVPGGGRSQSGTSFAAPYVSALIGLDVAKGAAKTAKAARRALMGQLLDLGPPGRDDLFGWGLIRHPRDCSPLIAG